LSSAPKAGQASGVLFTVSCWASESLSYMLSSKRRIKHQIKNSNLHANA
jgi:hypothetical protein